MADGRATPVVPNDHNSHMAGPEAHPSPRPRVVVLWSAPRSLSTAVERVMIEARNLECLWQQIEWLSSASFVSGAIRPRDPRVLRGTFLLGPRKGEATAHCPQWLSLESPGRWLPGECTSGVSTSRDESAPRAHVRRGSRAGVHIAAARGQSGSLLQRAGLLWCAQHTSAHASHPVADHVYPSALQQPFRTRWTSCSELATPTFNTRSLFATQPRLYGHSIARTESLASRLMRQRLVSQPCTRCCSGSRSYLLPGHQSYSTQMSLSPTLRRCEPWR